MLKKKELMFCLLGIESMYLFIYIFEQTILSTLGEGVTWPHNGLVIILFKIIFDENWTQNFSLTSED